VVLVDELVVELVVDEVEDVVDPVVATARVRIQVNFVDPDGHQPSGAYERTLDFLLTHIDIDSSVDPSTVHCTRRFEPHDPDADHFTASVERVTHTLITEADLPFVFHVTAVWVLVEHFEATTIDFVDLLMHAEMVPAACAVSVPLMTGTMSNIATRPGRTRKRLIGTRIQVGYPIFLHGWNA